MTIDQLSAEPAMREPEALGRIDLYGFTRRAGGMLFIGWVPHPLVDELGPGEFLLRTDATEVSAAGTAGCYVREQLGDLGLGMAVFLAMDEPPAGRPLTLTTASGRGRFAMIPGDTMREFTESDPPHWLGGVLTNVQPAFPEALVRALARRERQGRSSALEPILGSDAHESGFIEVFGYEEAFGGWLISGWVPPVAPEHRPAECRIGFNGRIEPKITARVAFFERADLGSLGIGIVLFIAASREHFAEPHPLEIALAGRMLPLQPIAGVTPISGQNLIDDIRARLEKVDEGPEKTALLKLLLADPDRGEATLGALTDRVLRHAESAAIGLAAAPSGALATAEPRGIASTSRIVPGLDTTRIDRDFSQIMRDWLDPTFYVSVYKDIKNTSISPAEHFHFHGWKENRDPGPNFCTVHYLSTYRDARAARINPVIYHELVGKFRGHVPAKSSEVPIVLFDAPGEKKIPFSASAITLANPEMRRFAFNVPRELSPVTNEYDPTALDIHWVVPDFSPGAGGHMNIFRICNRLEARGHKITIWIRDPNFHKNATSARETLHRHFEPLAGSIRFVDDGLADASGDIIVATDAWTVPIVCLAERFKRRFYFVQDLESTFWPAGARYLLADSTYRMDLDCICGGPWLEGLMAKTYGRWSRKFWQAADRSVYRPAPFPRAPIGSLPRIAFYCRAFSERRAVELGLLALELLAKRDFRFHVDFFGQAELPFSSVPYSATNYGVCDASTLARIYQNADIGLVFSATNYSIVPQEMMACRLPVLDLDVESTRAVYDPGAVRLVSPEPRAIANAIEDMLTSSEARLAQAERAETWVGQFSWRESAGLVEAAFVDRLDELGFQPVKPAISCRSQCYATVIIPVLNGGVLLKEVIRRVMSQCIPGDLQLICIDSGSTDGSVEYLEAQPGLDLIKIDKAEFQHGRTRNLGVAAARSEFVAFLTQDALPVDDCWLHNLICVLLSFPYAGGVFGQHVPYENVSEFVKQEIINYFAGFDELPTCISLDDPQVRARFRNTEDRQKFHFYSDNNSCLRKSVWNSVPIPEVNFGEDQLFAMELLKQGYGKAYARHALVYHSHDDSPEMVEQRSYIEAQFFYEHFGYRLVQSRDQAAWDVAARNRDDTLLARQRGVSKEDLARRFDQNKSRMDGYLRALGEYGLVH